MGEVFAQMHGLEAEEGPLVSQVLVPLVLGYEEFDKFTNLVINLQGTETGRDILTAAGQSVRDWATTTASRCWT